MINKKTIKKYFGLISETIKTIERKNISISEYKKGNFKNLQEFKIFWKMINLQYTQNNKEYFIKKFGRQDFVFRFEYVNYAWGFQLPSGRLIVFSGRKGTFFEFDGDSLTKEDIRLIKSLFEKV